MEINELLHHVTESRNIELSKEHWNKVKNIESSDAGSKVCVQFDNDENYIDLGYIFVLEGMYVDELDCIVHIPKPSCEKGDAPPEWIHMYSLMSNDRVTKIEVLTANAV